MSFSVNTLGFEKAPVSKFLILASGVSTFTFKFLPKSYKSLLLFNWADITRRKQIWRVFTSLFIYDRTLDALCVCMLVYHFILLERRWSSKKYMSFLIKNWWLSSCLYILAVKSLWEKPMNLMPFYGPLFSSLIYFYCDVPRSQASNGILSFLSDKTMVYLLAAQLFVSSEDHLLIATCGLVSGLIYRFNIFKIQQWVVIPSLLSNKISSCLSWFGFSQEKEVISQSALTGATPEIHQDILFDRMLRNQQQRQNIWRRQQNGGRNVSGQGYSEVLNPSFAQLFQNINQPPLIPPPVENQENPVENTPPSSQINDGKIEQLTNMGFERTSVVDALISANGDLQEATNILLSAS